MILRIDTEELDKLRADADKVFLEPEADDVILKFIAIEEAVALAKEDIKTRLLAKAREINPNFKSYHSDNVKIGMRAYGSKYYLDESQLQYAPPELFKTEVDVIAPNADVGKIKELFDSINCPIKTKKTKEGEELALKRVIDTKAVEKWEKQNRGLPAGIMQVKERPTSISYSRKEGEDKDE